MAYCCDGSVVINGICHYFYYLHFVKTTRRKKLSNRGKFSVAQNITYIGTTCRHFYLRPRATASLNLSISHSSSNLHVPLVTRPWTSKNVCANLTSALRTTYPHRLGKRMRHGHFFVYLTSNYMLDKSDCKVDPNLLVVHTGWSRMMKAII